MFAPIGRRKCICVHSWLMAEGILEQREEPVDFGVILVLCFLDRRLSKIVAQHVFGVYTIHPVTPVVVTAACAPQSVPIAHRPFVEAVSVEKVFPQSVVRRT